MKSGEQNRDWIAFGPPDLEKLIQSAFERVAEALDMPRRSDLDALNERIDRLTDLIEKQAKTENERD